VQAVFGWQTHMPAALQTFGAVQVPQFTTPPQPSDCVPHC
jgi:hypothetical protein